MTVSSTTSQQPYAGDGVTVAFSIPFPFFSSGDSPELFPDVEVYLRNISTGAETLQVITTHYTIAIDAGTEPQQGDVTMVTAPTVDQELHLVRSTALTQATSFTVNGPFPATEHEKALDRAALRTIDQAATLNRGLRFPRTDPESISAELPSSVDRAGKYLAFSSTGEIIVSASATDTSTTSDFMEDVLASATTGEAKTLLEVEDMNLIYNSCGEVAQRGGFSAGKATSDLDYIHDGIKVLSDGNGRVTATVPGINAIATARTGIGGVSVGTNKWLYGHVLEANDTALLISSGGLEVGLNLRTNPVAQTVHLYVLKSTGTPNSPNAEPVTAWGADGVTPTFGNDWELVTEKAMSQTDTSFQTQTLTVTGGISDAQNIAIYIGPGKDSPVALGTMILANFTCVPLGASTYSVQHPYAEELQRSRRFYWQTIPTVRSGTHAVAADAAGLAGAIRFAASEGGDPNFARDIRNPVQMLKAGTYVFFNPLTGTAAQAHNVTDTSTTAVDAENASVDGARIGPTATDATDDGDDMALHMTVANEL